METDFCSLLGCPGSPCKEDRAQPCTGHTLRDLKFIIYLFIFLPKTQSTNEWDLELVSGFDFWCNLYYFWSRGRFRGSRGLPWAENRPKTRGRLYQFILPEVCPVNLPKSASIRNNSVQSTLPDAKK